MINVSFSHNVNPSESEFRRLSKVIKTQHRQEFLYPSFKSLIFSETCKLCCLYIGDEIVSFAIYMARNWNINKSTLKSISLGYVTTFPEFQRKGFASLLLKYIEDYFGKMNIDFIYLQGIEDFYFKFGYKGFSTKSKFIFHKKNFQNPIGKIVSCKKTDIKIVKKIHNNFYSKKNIFIHRDDQIWRDFFSDLSNSYLFFKPKIILDDDSNPIIYFCTTPGDHNYIREFIPCDNIQKLEQAISLIFKEFEIREKLEIFSHKYGLIHDLAIKNGGDYIEYIRPKSSNMIKILNKNLKFDNFSSSFLLQGDNA